MYAVIMAGGKGARFWPRSRNRLPKHLLDICSEKTIIQETVARILPLAPPEKILIVTGASHARELIGQLPQIPPENILIEPMGRNTAPCIGLAALVVRKRSGNAVMAVLPSDHLIADEDNFRHVLAAAADMAARGNHLVTIGIRPTGPETGYGYIEEGKLAARERGEDIFAVKSIREKPDLELAKTFLAQGGFFWNSGMFIWQAATILKEMEASLPDIYAGLLTIDKALDTPAEATVIADVYDRFRSISIDYGVMEKAKNTLVIPADFGWSDVGSWDALWEVSEKDALGITSRNREGLISINSRNSLVYSPKKLVALVDVEDLIVVETDDALLICKRGASQEVKKVVEVLEEKKREEYL
ncbi:MAG: sugar phosphate nucleotidyltransferase [Syntrophales bacterium]|jgi:mannose-1-phosphate guanylyltransferase|nr:sugar phosphate nucleotidyltransferase [Syntrophales bacterium]MCK9390984.1 sugar phosphate nucleotidyltransferase [Syntrophales bacterium]